MNAAFSLQLFYLASAMAGAPVEGVEKEEPSWLSESLFDDCDVDEEIEQPRAWGASAGHAH
jgi:hypothetical protein